MCATGLVSPPAPAVSVPVAAQPRWHEVLRALREARGVTQDGWVAQIGVSRKTVQRWEAGERVPDAGAEALLVTYCRERGLFRTFQRGPLAGLELTPEVLHDLLAEARWRVGGGLEIGARVAPVRPAAGVSAVRSLDHISDDRTPDSDQRQPPSNLPASLTSFVGRELELAAVRRTLGGTRLLTLIGAGGCGKTRLALALAEELLWAYPDGIYFVELAALADPTLVPATVAAALDLEPAGRQPVTELLVEQLAPRHLLLLLDNCEHVLPSCALLVETVLRACPHVEVVATSREPLSVGGETLWQVPPLELPPARPNTHLPTPVAQFDAVRLFVERARLYRPDFALSDANEAAVVQICQRLDGIPLAIELASACIKVLSVEQIVERLSDRFRLLTGGRRTALPRHQTLQATMDWSYDLLTPPEQALLRRLAVFAGGFTLEAAEFVCGPGEEGEGHRAREGGDPLPYPRYPLPAADVLAILSSLVDKSLVNVQHRDGAVRYGLLETVRQYASEHLDAAGETVAAHDRHRKWCLALGEMAEAARHASAEGERLTRLEEEHDNLRAALAWSLAHGDDQGEAALRLAGSLARFWEVHGHLSEGRQWLVQALAAGGNAPATVRARALDGAWWLAYMQGDYAAARAFADRSLTLSRAHGDAHGIARAHNQLAGIALRCGDHTEACALMEKSLALHAEIGDTWGIAAAQRGLGIIALRHGDYVAARSRLEASLTLHRERGNKEGIANALEDLATVAGEQDDAEQQAALLAEALALFRELGNKGGVALVLGDLGMQAWLQGEHGRAEALLDESLALYRERSERRGIARVLAHQGLLALHQRDYNRAAALCRESLTLSRDLGDRWAIGHYLPVLAGVAFGRDQAERAARLVGAAAALRERLGTPLPRVVQPNHDRMIAKLRRALGEQEFAAAWAAGEAMSVDEALDYALAPVALPATSDVAAA